MLFEVFLFTSNSTVTESVVLMIEVNTNIHQLVKQKQALKVEDINGLSNVINESIIEVNSERDYPCRVWFSWSLVYPLYGRLIEFSTKEPVETVSEDCHSFLSLGLQYKHLKTSSPNEDFIPLLFVFLLEDVEVIRWIQLKVFISTSSPNNAPMQSSSSSSLHLNVDQFILTSLTSNSLSATDLETPFDDLIFNVTRPLGPDEGFITHLIDNSRPITSFRQSDISKSLIAYQPPSLSFGSSVKFTIALKVIDSYFLTSSEFFLCVSIRKSGATAPRIYVNHGITLLEGQAQQITTKHLQIVDKDNIDSIKIFITGGLNHGVLQLHTQSDSFFSMQDIENARLTYKHDGSNSKSDFIKFHVTDGLNDVRFKFPIRIISSDDNAPVLINHSTLHVNQQGAIVIQPEDLSAFDADSRLEDIVYSIIVQPRYGKICKKSRQMGSLKKLSQFSQKDIKNGVVIYRHGNNKVCAIHTV